MKKLSVLLLLALAFQPLLQGSAARLAVDATPGTYDDTNLTVWSYSGTWVNYASAAAYLQTLHISTVVTSEAALSFSGDRFELIYARGPAYGVLDIYLDGAPTPLTSLNQNNATNAPQQRWNSGPLSNATHTLRFVHASGTYANVDGIQIFGPADVVVPDPIVDLEADPGPTGGTATLNWTAPGDDGAIGTATAYLVRYSTSAITNLTEWNLAKAATSGLPAPAPAGSPQSMTVSGLSPGVTYFFAVRARDEVSNLGALSNNPSAAAKASTAFGVGKFENTHPNFIFTGAWAQTNTNSASGANYRSSSTVGNSIGFMFSGTTLQIGYASGTQYGKLDIYVDGVKVSTLNQYSSTTKWKKSWPIGTFSNGLHSILLVHATGTKVNMDFINIPISWPTISTQFVVGGLSSPVLVTHAGDGSGRIFIVEQNGRIQIYDNGAINPTPFLDITSLVNFGGERGLLSLAFPPNYETSGHFYVVYTRADGDIILSRFGLTGNPDIADDSSEQVILNVEHSAYSNHNGAHLAFGSDGYLYVSYGDGGGSGDPLGSGQNKNTLLGKILRLDVETGNPATYTIPPSNPFVGVVGLDEIWSYGLRNPWRFSFDRLTNDMYIADVGQNAWEEVDFQAAGFAGGANYGWKVLEGKHCYSPLSGCVNPPGYVPPVVEYSHSLGCSISGGYVYRGTSYPSLQGIYFYADYCSGRIWGLQRVNSIWSSAQLLATSLSINSFGEDEAGNLYLVDLGGGIYRVTAP